MLTATNGLRQCKGSVFEGGIRVPGFVRWPGVIPAHVRSPVPVYTPDVLPTVRVCAWMTRLFTIPAAAHACRSSTFLGCNTPTRRGLRTVSPFSHSCAATPASSETRRSSGASGRR